MDLCLIHSYFCGLVILLASNMVKDGSATLKNGKMVNLGEILMNFEEKIRRKRRNENKM